MKYRKQQRILAGVTRVRIHLRMTQESFALYIGVSKSLVSMVENGNRHLPFKALEKVCKLEQDWQSIVATETAVAEPREAAAAKTADSWQQAQLRAKQLRLQELQYEYKKMTARYEELMKTATHFQQLLNMPRHEPGSRERKVLEFQMFKLDQELKTCDFAARTRKKYKIALLEQLIKGEDVKQRANSLDIGLIRWPLLPQIAA